MLSDLSACPKLVYQRNLNGLGWGWGKARHLFVVALIVMMTSIFNATTSAVGLTILFHFDSNAASVFVPHLPEETGGELAMFRILCRPDACCRPSNGSDQGSCLPMQQSTGNVDREAIAHNGTYGPLNSSDLASNIAGYGRAGASDLRISLAREYMMKCPSPS
jgi:hypothetical protein